MPSLRSALLSIGAPMLLSAAFHGGALALAVTMFKPAETSSALTPLDVTFVAPEEPVAAPNAPAEGPIAVIEPPVEKPAEEAKTEPAETPPPEPEPSRPVTAEVMPPTPEIAMPALPELVPLTLPNLAENSVDGTPAKTGKPPEDKPPVVIPPVSAPRKLAAQPKPKPTKPVVAKREPKSERLTPPRQLASRESDASAGTGGSGVAAKGVPERAGGPNSADALAYRGLVGSHLARFKRYPDSARARNAEGVPAVSFSLDGAGRVLSVSLARSTGQGDLDAEVVQMVRRASPFPTPPAGAVRSFTISIRYRMD